MPSKNPASAGRARSPSGYDFSAARRGALSDITGPSFASIMAAEAAADRKRPKGEASLRTASKPRGALTRAAGNVVRSASRALGSSEKDAERRGVAFEQFNEDWNPLTGADMVGTQLRRLADGDRDFDKGALARGALSAASEVAPFAAAPAAKALARTKAGKKIVGALTHVEALPEADNFIEGTARTVATRPKERPIRDVRTKEGAIVTPAPKGRPDRALSMPDDSKTIPVKHYSHTRGLTEASPRMMGTNPTNNMSKSERQQMSRVYLGENRGETTDYKPRKDTGIGPYEYDANIPERKVVTVGSPEHQMFKNIMSEINDDPAKMKAWGFKPHDSAQHMVETLQREAGFSARRFPDEFTPYGAALHSFEPVKLTRSPETPLRGQPLKLDAQGPHQDLRDTARQYMIDGKRRYDPSSEYLKVDPDRGAAIAQAYEEMPHAPNDPEVQKAYRALSEETLGQYEALKRDGYQFGFYPRDEAGEIIDPYASPFDALRDIRGSGKAMKVYPTDAGYGSDGQGISDEMIAENPMLALIPGETWDGQPVRVNDAFRAVHDAFGHAKDGVGFRADGEENAWNAHRTMYSPAAQRAMSTETRGQNSWLNFGPHGAANRTASTADTVFAPQKIGLLPDWVLDPNGMPD